MPIASFEEIKARIGSEIGLSDWILVDQQAIDTFADVTGDHQFIHVDPVAAAQTPFGGTVAHGFLTLSLLSHLSEQTFSYTDRKMGVNYGLNRVRFTSPVPAGARVRARFTLAKYEPIEGNGVQVTWNTVVEIEGQDKPALVAEWIGRHYY